MKREIITTFIISDINYDLLVNKLADDYIQQIDVAKDGEYREQDSQSLNCISQGEDETYNFFRTGRGGCNAL